jgi:hypothetical protein
MKIFDFEKRGEDEFLISRKIRKEIAQSYTNKTNGKKGGNPNLKKSDNRKTTETDNQKDNQTSNSNSIFNSDSEFINYIHCNKKFLFEKIEKLNQQQQIEIENLFQLYFSESVKKEHPKSAVQQQIIFDLMPTDFTFEELKKNINEAISAGYQTIFWKKEKNFAPKKENASEALKDKIYLQPNEQGF